MNRPKFEVGEEVILESKKCPDLNGEYSVRHKNVQGEGKVGCYYD